MALNFSQSLDSEAPDNATNCKLGLTYEVAIAATDLITVAVGHPVTIMLLWLAFTSKKTVDILNLNLALIHNIYYCISFLHFLLFTWGVAHIPVLWFLLMYAQIGGTLSLCFICVERYVAVMHPTHFPLLTKYRCRKVVASLAWILSIGVALDRVLFRHKRQLRLVLGSLPGVVMSVFGPVIGYCSFQVARVLRQLSPGQAKQQPNKRRALRTVRATTIIVICCYMPVATIQQIPATNTTQECFVVPFCVFLLSIASVVHPLFYLRTQRKFPISFKINKQNKH